MSRVLRVARKGYDRKNGADPREKTLNPGSVSFITRRDRQVDHISAMWVRTSFGWFCVTPAARPSALPGADVVGGNTGPFRSRRVLAQHRKREAQCSRILIKLRHSLGALSDLCLEEHVQEVFRRASDSRPELLQAGKPLDEFFARVSHLIALLTQGNPDLLNQVLAHAKLAQAGGGAAPQDRQGTKVRTRRR